MNNAAAAQVVDLELMMYTVVTQMPIPVPFASVIKHQGAWFLRVPLPKTLRLPFEDRRTTSPPLLLAFVGLLPTRLTAHTCNLSLMLHVLLSQRPPLKSRCDVVSGVGIFDDIVRLLARRHKGWFDDNELPPRDAATRQHNFSSTSLLPPASPSQTTSAALIFWEGTRQSHFFISNPISLYSSILSRNKIFFQTLLLIIERKNNNTLKHSRQKQVKTFLPNKFDFLCHPLLCQVCI